MPTSSGMTTLVLASQSRGPNTYTPWDWHQLYVEDESVWPDLIVEAAAAAENGELQYYERRLHA
jgi:hypothetical protein